MQQPWKVLTVRKSASKYEPHSITLENHNYLPDHPNFRTSWQVDLNGPNKDQYDLSRARYLD